MKILITGFEPFGADKENASWQAVCCLPDRIGKAEIVKKQLPVSYGRVGAQLKKYITLVFGLLF